jgi:hypothetical protein
MYFYHFSMKASEKVPSHTLVQIDQSSVTFVMGFTGAIT